MFPENDRIYRIGFVSEISQAAGQLLVASVEVVVILFGAVVHHGHYVRIVRFLIVIERVEEHAKSVEVIGGAKHRTLRQNFRRVEERQAVGT